jgi:hypothetical protein
MARGESGYVRSAVQVTVGGNYSLGGGPAGYTGGVTYQFFTKLRENDYQQQRQDTFDGIAGSRSTGVGGRTSRKVNMTIYYKGATYPPDFEQFEVVLIAMQFGGGLIRQEVIILESFKQTGDVEKALEYTVTGESDDVFN